MSLPPRSLRRVLPTGLDLRLNVMSYNDGSFTGPADSTSTMNIRGDSTRRTIRINP